MTGLLQVTVYIQTFQPAALSDSCVALVMPVFMIAVAVAAFWFANMFAIACSMIILSTFSTVLFLRALCNSKTVIAAVVTLCELDVWYILSCAVEAVIDVNDFTDTAVCSMRITCKDNNHIIIILS